MMRFSLALPGINKQNRVGTIPERGSNSEKSLMSFDLLYQLSYMSVIAASGAPRSRIFEYAARLPCASAEYFRNVEIICTRMKCDYAKACRMVGETAQSEEIKGLLLRLSSSLLSGESEADFLAREAESCATSYDSQYGKSLEALKMWSDAYISLILSAGLIIIIGMISTMIWPVEQTFLVGMVTVSVIATFIGVWLLHLISPKERITLRRAGSRKQKLARKMLLMMLPGAFVAGAVMSLAGIDLGWILVVMAALVMPVGIVSVSDENEIDRRDSELASFLSSLGGVCAAIGSTVKEALSRLDLNAINVLRREVKHLNTRLHYGIRNSLCWQQFIEESGSELANRSVGMFCNAIDLGGEPEQAGRHASLFTSRLAILRMKRKAVSSPFLWLCVAMHASVVALLIFITEVITGFGQLVANMNVSIASSASSVSTAAFTSFNIEGMEMMQVMVVPVVIVLTIANALAPNIVAGGSRHKVLFNVGITVGITGISLVALPPLARMLFHTVQQL